MRDNLNVGGKWSIKSMEEAVTATISGGCFRTVEKQFNVPRNTPRHVSTHKKGLESSNFESVLF